MSDPKVDYANAPHDPSVANDFGVRKFTVTTTHAANALPTDWFLADGTGRGQYLTLYATVDTHFAFSKRATPEVDSAVAATAAGASDKVGMFLPAGTYHDVYLTRLRAGELWYFVREAGAAGDVYVQKSSD